VVVGLTEPERLGRRLLQVGFSEELAPGERVLPARLGTRSLYNAEGKWLVHRDRPKEPRVVGQREWHWTEFRGRYDREEMSRIVDVVRDCYPRTFVPPPAVELTVATRADDRKFVIADPVINNRANADLLLHVVNLFLELFGQAELLTENLDGYIVTEVRRLNWTLLPPGEMPWDQLERHVRPHVNRAPEGNRPVLLHRLNTLNGYAPTFTATGRGGFTGYIVFGFPEKNLYVLESLFYGNATYVFEDQWETLSRLTKAEVLQGQHEKARIVHREGWEREVGKLLA
jgi:hypothetical protein